MFSKKNKGRFRVYNGYIFDRRIFQSVIFVIILFFAFIVIINGVKPKYYYSCDSELDCDLSYFQAEYCFEPSKLDYVKRMGFQNFLDQSGLCSMEVAPAGYSYGEKAKFQGFEFLFTLLYIVLGFVINHYKHNKGFEFKGEW